jgi:WD40 repeat protein
VYAVSWSPCGKWLASGGLDDQTVRTWEAATGKELSQPRGEAPIHRVAFSPDGKLIAAGDGYASLSSKTGTIRLYDAGTRAVGHSRSVRSVSWSPDGTKVATGSLDETVRIWDAATGTCESTLRGDWPINSVAFSPDGQQIAAGCGKWGQSGEILIFKLQESGDWEMQSQSRLRGHCPENPECICYPDSDEDEEKKEDSDERFWDSDEERPCSRRECLVRGHRDYVKQVQFADDDTLVSANGSGMAKVWNIATGEQKTEALAGSQSALSKQGGRKQQTGRFVCTADGDLLLIHLLAEVEDDEKKGAGDAGNGEKAATAARAPVAFFNAPSQIEAPADIALGCESGEVMLLRAAMLLT